MPFNCYNESSFTEMCGYGYFGIRKRSVFSLTMQCTLFCHGPKNFSGKAMSDVTSYTD